MCCLSIHSVHGEEGRQSPEQRVSIAHAHTQALLPSPLQSAHVGIGIPPRPCDGRKSARLQSAQLQQRRMRPSQSSGVTNQARMRDPSVHRPYAINGHTTSMMLSNTGGGPIALAWGALARSSISFRRVAWASCTTLCQSAHRHKRATRRVRHTCMSLDDSPLRLRMAGIVEAFVMAAACVWCCGLARL